MSKKIAERKKKKREEQKHKQKIYNDQLKIKERKLKRLESLNEVSQKIKPIVNPVYMANEKALENIENNLKILKALEEDYINSQKSKSNLKEELESEGFSSLEEKMEFLNKKARKEAEEKSKEFFNEAEEETEDNNFTEKFVGELKSLD